MQFYSDIALAVTIASLVSMIIGLYKPWVMLWWEDTQNRKKVIQVYGTSSLVFYVVSLVLSYLA